MIREGITETVEAMRRRTCEPSPESAEAAELRAAIWQREHARQAAIDAALCAKAGMEPNGLVSLATRQRIAAWIAEREAAAELHRAREEGRGAHGAPCGSRLGGGEPHGVRP